MRKALRTSIPAILVVTAFLFAFQNCSEMAYDAVYSESSSTFPMNATESPKVDAEIVLPLETNMESVQSSLYRGLEQYRFQYGMDLGVMSLKLDHGHNLIANDENQALVCHFSPSSSANDNMVGAQVISIGCIFNSTEIDASQEESSLAGILYKSLELLSLNNDPFQAVQNIANGFMIEDSFTQLSCTFDNNKAYSCIIQLK